MALLCFSNCFNAYISDWLLFLYSSCLLSSFIYNPEALRSIADDLKDWTFMGTTLDDRGRKRNTLQSETQISVVFFSKHLHLYTAYIPNYFP